LPRGDLQDGRAVTLRRFRGAHRDCLGSGSRHLTALSLPRIRDPAAPRLASARLATLTDNAENLILEHLRAMRGDLAGIKADLGELKLRVSSREERMTLLERSIANLHGDIVIVHARLDRMDARIERIEKRLELTSA
jgi:septal ring factor EnvC (AmiA/AmiB activator)